MHDFLLSLPNSSQLLRGSWPTALFRVDAPSSGEGILGHHVLLLLHQRLGCSPYEAPLSVLRVGAARLRLRLGQGVAVLELVGHAAVVAANRKLARAIATTNLKQRQHKE